LLSLKPNLQKQELPLLLLPALPSLSKLTPLSEQVNSLEPHADINKPIFSLAFQQVHHSLALLPVQALAVWAVLNIKPRSLPPILTTRPLVNPDSE